MSIQNPYLRIQGAKLSPYVKSNAGMFIAQAGRDLGAGLERGINAYQKKKQDEANSKALRTVEKGVESFETLDPKDTQKALTVNESGTTIMTPTTAGMIDKGEAIQAQQVVNENKKIELRNQLTSAEDIQAQVGSIISQGGTVQDVTDFKNMVTGINTQVNNELGEIKGLTNLDKARLQRAEKAKKRVINDAAVIENIPKRAQEKYDSIIAGADADTMLAITKMRKEEARNKLLDSRYATQQEQIAERFRLTKRAADNANDKVQKEKTDRAQADIIDTMNINPGSFNLDSNQIKSQLNLSAQADKLYADYAMKYPQTRDETDQEYNDRIAENLGPVMDKLTQNGLIDEMTKATIKQERAVKLKAGVGNPLSQDRVNVEYNPVIKAQDAAQAAATAQAQDILTRKRKTDLAFSNTLYGSDSKSGSGKKGAKGALEVDLAPARDNFMNDDQDKAVLLSKVLGAYNYKNGTIKTIMDNAKEEGFWDNISDETIVNLPTDVRNTYLRMRKAESNGKPITFAELESEGVFKSSGMTNTERMIQLKTMQDNINNKYTTDMSNTGISDRLRNTNTNVNSIFSSTDVTPTDYVADSAIVPITPVVTNSNQQKAMKTAIDAVKLLQIGSNTISPKDIPTYRKGSTYISPIVPEKRPRRSAYINRGNDFNERTAFATDKKKYTTLVDNEFKTLTAELDRNKSRRGIQGYTDPTTGKIISEQVLREQAAANINAGLAKYDETLKVPKITTVTPTSSRLHAVGNGQYLKATIDMAITNGYIDADKPFDKKAQDAVFDMILDVKRGKTVGAFLKGKDNVTVEDAALGLAQEWAAIATEKDGKSYYGNGNKASIPYKKIKKLLLQAKKTGNTDKLRDAIYQAESGKDGTNAYNSGTKGNSIVKKVTPYYIEGMTPNELNKGFAKVLS